MARRPRAASASCRAATGAGPRTRIKGSAMRGPRVVGRDLGSDTRDHRVRHRQQRPAADRCISASRPAARGNRHARGARKKSRTPVSSTTLPRIEHRQLLADLGHDAQVMRDEQERRAVPGLHRRRSGSGSLLHRHVQRGCGFIRDDQLRFRRKGRGDQDALAHPAGQLVRIAAASRGPGRGCCTSSSSSSARASALARVQPRISTSRSVICRADPARGVQRGQRVLRDQRAAGPDQAAAVLRRQSAAGRSPSSMIWPDSHFDCAGQDAQHRLADHRLARAAFADQPAHLARRDRQRHIAQDRVAACPSAGPTGCG